MKHERGLHELYAENEDRADLEVFGRVADPTTRRGFLKGLATMAAVVGGHIVFHRWMPAGLIPAVLADTPPFRIAGKNGLIVLNDRPVNAETPPHLLNDDVTPAEHLFVRNNGLPPENIDVDTWALTIDGESVITPKTYTIDELRRRFKNVDYQLTLECGGNGRAEFYPPARGNQWTLGAVGAPRWNGVRLKDVLSDCGVKKDGVYIGYYGADTHLSGDADKRPISRGVPIDKALERESMIAWGMNGQPLPLVNGYPLRLVFGGWPGSTSGKWLRRIAIRNKVHDGAKMGGQSYRVPCDPVMPGTEVADEDMCIIESMPVKSLITLPKTGIHQPMGEALTLHGHAWAGDLTVSKVHVSIDFGKSWQKTDLDKPANKLAWQHWHHTLEFPAKGYYEVWARATDSRGISQPMVVPGWNPKGYLNNATHRIGVLVT